MSNDERINRAFDGLQALATKLGLRLDDVRAEHEARARDLINRWRDIAPKSDAAVFEFEFDAGQGDVQSLRKRVGGYRTERGVIMRDALSLDWLSYFCAKYDLLARSCKATFVCRIVEQPMSGNFPPDPPHSSKSAEPQFGVPYKPDTTLTIDDWSHAVFRSFADWPVAASGEWTRWEPGYLVLEIQSHDGRTIDPVVLDSANDELTVSFGFWETHLPGPDYLGAENDNEASVRDAKMIIEDWLFGRTRTAVYFSADDKWCGTITVDPIDLNRELSKGVEWAKSFLPTRIELRVPEQANWRFFRILPGGSVEEVARNHAP